MKHFLNIYTGEVFETGNREEYKSVSLYPDYNKSGWALVREEDFYLFRLIYNSGYKRGYKEGVGDSHWRA